MTRQRAAFTLIEVMVAVMIITVVIGALWQMKGDASQKFFTLNKMIQTNQYSSFLLSNSEKYGFEKSHIDLNSLLDGFDLESDLRRKLKAIKVQISYELVDSLDNNDTMILEIGKTKMEADNFTNTLVRVRMQ